MTRRRRLTWAERIRRATRANGFTATDRRLAGNYLTCAVGEQHERFPKVVVYSNRDGMSTPVDLVLDRFGYDFYLLMCAGDVGGVARVLKQIRERVRVLRTRTRP